MGEGMINMSKHYRLTDSNIEIPSLTTANQNYWLSVYFKLKTYEDGVVTLHEFINRYLRNSIVRLWVPYESGHKMLVENDLDSCMEWEITKGHVWQSKYLNNNVLGVRDIVVDGFLHKEAINIIISVEE